MLAAVLVVVGDPEVAVEALITAPVSPSRLAPLGENDRLRVGGHNAQLETGP